MSELKFFVPGEPIPEGSTKAFQRGGKIIVTHDNDRLRSWRQAVQTVAVAAARQQGWPLEFDGPVVVGVTFWLPRPKRPRFDVPAVKPDLDKLQRAIGDGLCPKVGPGVLAEDSRIVCWHDPTKRYADLQHPVGAAIVVTDMTVPF